MMEENGCKMATLQTQNLSFTYPATEAIPGTGGRTEVKVNPV